MKFTNGEREVIVLALEQYEQFCFTTQLAYHDAGDNLNRDFWLNRETLIRTMQRQFAYACDYKEGKGND